MSNLFDQTNTPIVIDEQKNWLEELVGEGKKFKDPVELAKGKAFSDAHIANLERTLNEMRAELQTRKTAEDLINQINLANQRVDPNRTQNQPEPDGNTNQDIKSGLTPEDVERLFEEREARRRKESNLNQTTQELQKTYGDNAANALRAKAEELGVDTQYLKNLAQDSPKIFLSLFNKPEAPKNDIFSAPAPSSFRPNTNAYTGEKWSDFNKVKQTDPSLYWSPKFQRRIIEAAERATEAGVYEKFMSS